MHRRFSRALLPAVAAAALAATGTTAATGATTGTAARAQGVGAPIYSAHFSGYHAHTGTGWRFRWITTTLTIPSCSAVSASHGWAGNAIRLGSDSHKWQAGFLARCDAGGTSAGARLDWELLVNGTVVGPTDIGLLPLAGHQVTLSVYYDQPAGTVRFVAGDNTAHDAMVHTVHVGTGAAFYGAGAGSVFLGTITAPPRDVRTGALSDTELTSYNGHKGSMLGPWTTAAVIATAGGTSTGDVIASASELWNRGANFSVWQRTTA